MKTENIKKLESFFGEIYKNSEHHGNSVLDYLDLNEIEDLEYNYQNLVERLEENNFFQIDIIYYSNAIEYLKNNDPSLLDSINIALDYGFELKDINSELLASLLASENFKNEFFSYEDKIISLFVNIEFDELNDFVNELKKENEN